MNVSNTTPSHSVSNPYSATRAGLMAQTLSVFAIGALLVAITGFSHAAAIHDAAHDTRHTLAFPCH